MPENDGTVSDSEPAERPTNSVFDFLYHDAPRVASFLAQFDPSGHLLSLRQTEGVEQTTEDKAGGNVSGGVPAVVKGTGLYESRTATVGKEGAERSYDPLWANARELLNLLSDRLVRDLTQARIGQFVMATGAFGIVDLSLFRSLWSMQSVRAAALENQNADSSTGQSRADRRRQSRVKAPSADETNVDALLKFIGAMPHLTHAVMKTNSGEKVWSSLREGSLVGSSGDLMLKHGIAIRGDWTMVGLLDALPEIDEDGEVQMDAVMDMSRLDGALPGVLAQGLKDLAFPLRTALGRPFTHFGITPLMIFREAEAIAPH